ncbi:MAG TPA: M56 family metallopeptidase [Candidatus Baltobacteraceae bacterium]|nr:M56 family metallopeptidase [Candidatus Baltobacteraceae bacterium]
MNALADSALQFAFAMLLNSLWEGIAIALLCAVILRFTAKANATTRASVLTVALIATIAVPVLTTVAAMSLRSVPPLPPAWTATARHAASRPATHTVSRPQAHAATRPTAQHEILLSRPIQATAQPKTAFPRLHISIPRVVVDAIVGLWIVAALIALLRLASSLLHLERLKHDALPLSIEYRSRMERWTSAAKGGRGVRLCRSPEIVIPIAVGLFDAMILVPETLIDELSPEDVDRIVLHELAHLRRGDDWINAIERIAQALFFFNPGILWIVGQLDLEREVVCDDWVLNQTAEIRQYATCLARVAEITAWPYRAMAAPGAFITRRSMSIRVERLLEAGRDIRTRTSLGPAGSAVAILAVLGILAAFVSPSVAYTTQARQAQHAANMWKQLAKRSASPAPLTKNRTVTKAPLAQTAPSPAEAATTPVSPPPLMRTIPSAPAGVSTRATAISRFELKQTFAIRTQTHAKANATVQVALNAQPAPAGGTPALRSETLAASSPDYISELESQGYRNLSLDDLIRLKSVGVTAQYIRDLESAGLPHPSVEDLIRLAAVGVDGNYVRQMRRMFAGVSANDLAGIKAVGVTGDYINALRAAGYANLSFDDVRRMRAVGVDSAYIREMRATFPNVTADDLAGMKAVGVTSDYINALRAAGYTDLSFDDVRRMRAVGVDSAYVRELRAKFPGVTAGELTRLRAVGVTSEFIRDAEAHGFHNLTIDQLIRLKASGIL